MGHKDSDRTPLRKKCDSETLSLKAGRTRFSTVTELCTSHRSSVTRANPPCAFSFQPFTFPLWPWGARVLEVRSAFRSGTPQQVRTFDRLAERLSDSCFKPDVTLSLVGRAWFDEAIPYGDWYLVEKHLSRQINGLISQTKKATTKDAVNGFIVLDTVNLLADIIQHKIFSPNRPVDMRGVMHGIWTILENSKRQANESHACNLILIGEHHPGAPYDAS